MKKISKNITLLFFILLHPLTFGIGQAVVIVPVVDALLEELPTISATIPLCADKDLRDGKRAHQLLFNERVTIEKIDEQSGKAWIKIPYLYFCTYDSKRDNLQKINSYWVPLHALKVLHDNDDISPFPKPISYEKRHIPDETKEPSIATLCIPWRDTKTNIAYSAGTRFVRTDYPAKSESDSLISLSCFHPKTNRSTIIKIPRTHCIIDSDKQPREQQIAHFVTLLKEWANHSTGIIPYVWGGCSFIERYPNEQFTAVADDASGHFIYQSMIHQNPKSGFDCSGLISRAAQIVGLPYYAKNTRTIRLILDPLGADDAIRNGDIIWIEGHVFIISDKDNNKLIEASSYRNGTGRVHEITLSAIFEGINTFEQLKKIHLDQTPVPRINTRTKDVTKPVVVSILKLESIWNNPK
jgi:hypothetical protein